MGPCESLKVWEPEAEVSQFHRIPIIAVNVKRLGGDGGTNTCFSSKTIYFICKQHIENIQ